MRKRLLLLVSLIATPALAQPTPPKSRFRDVPPGHWAHDAINELAGRGILRGYPDGTFGGDRVVTRGEAAVANRRSLQNGQAPGSPGAPLGTRSAVPRNRLTPGQPAARPQSGISREEVQQLRREVDQLSRLAAQLRETLSVLRAEVNQLKRQVGTMGERRPDADSRFQPPREPLPQRLQEAK